VDIVEEMTLARLEIYQKILGGRPKITGRFIGVGSYDYRLNISFRKYFMHTITLQEALDIQLRGWKPSYSGTTFYSKGYTMKPSMGGSKAGGKGKGKGGDWDLGDDEGQADDEAGWGKASIAPNPVKIDQNKGKSPAMVGKGKGKSLANVGKGNKVAPAEAYSEEGSDSQRSERNNDTRTLKQKAPKKKRIIFPKTKIFSQETVRALISFQRNDFLPLPVMFPRILTQPQSQFHKFFSLTSEVIH
jgi:hypothetical protein